MHTVWLGHYAFKPIFLKIGHYGIIWIAAGNDPFDMGIYFHQFPDRLLAAHTPSNGQIQNNCIKGFSGFHGFFVDLNSFGAFFGKAHFVPQIIQ